MDRHGNWATAVAAGQLEAVKMAGVRLPDMCGLFIPSCREAHWRRIGSKQKRRLDMRLATVRR